MGGSFSVELNSVVLFQDTNFTPSSANYNGGVGYIINDSNATFTFCHMIASSAVSGGAFSTISSFVNVQDSVVRSARASKVANFCRINYYFCHMADRIYFLFLLGRLRGFDWWCLALKS